jgi:hypothetical protein
MAGRRRSLFKAWKLETRSQLCSVSVPPFTFEEAEPLLKAISKIRRVTLVPESPYANGFSSYPRICFLDNGPFGLLNRAMPRFPGKTSWVILSDLPRCYLAATVAWKKPSAGSFYTPVPEESDFTVVNTPEAEQEKPLPSSSEELRQWAIEDVPALAAFIEEQLELKDKPSLGVEVSTADLELPLVEDAAATGNETVNVLLAADPEAFLNKRTPTSEYDRLLHSWITDEEYGRLYDALRDTLHWQNLPMLARIAEQGIYGVLTIQRQDVPQLASECELAARDPTLNLTDTLNKILRVSRSAMAYNLGLVIEGD